MSFTAGSPPRRHAFQCFCGKCRNVFFKSAKPISIKLPIFSIKNLIPAKVVTLFLENPVGHNCRCFPDARKFHFGYAMFAKEIISDRVLGVVDAIIYPLSHFQKLFFGQ